VTRLPLEVVYVVVATAVVRSREWLKFPVDWSSPGNIRLRFPAAEMLTKFSILKCLRVTDSLTLRHLLGNRISHTIVLKEIVGGQEVISPA